MDHIGIDLLNMNNKWVKFELTNINTFIIRVQFRLINVDTIHTLKRHEHELPPLDRTTCGETMTKHGTAIANHHLGSIT